MVKSLLLLQGLAAVLLMCGVVCAALATACAGGRVPAAVLVQAMGGALEGKQVTIILCEDARRTTCHLGTAVLASPRKTRWHVCVSFALPDAECARPCPVAGGGVQSWCTVHCPRSAIASAAQNGGL